MPVDVGYLKGLMIEPLDGARHDREPFSCGVERIDNFFKITATKFVKNDDGKIYVAVEAATGRIAGYYAIAPHAIDVSAFDEDARKRLPSHPTVSAYYLSMIGVDVTAQGRGLGTYLLGDVLARCMKAADISGGRFIVLDAIDEAAARLYARMGFKELASHPGRMIIAMAKVRKNAAAVAGSKSAAA